MISMVKRSSELFVEGFTFVEHAAAANGSFILLAIIQINSPNVCYPPTVKYVPSTTRLNLLILCDIPIWSTASGFVMPYASIIKLRNSCKYYDCSYFSIRGTLTILTTLGRSKLKGKGDVDGIVKRIPKTLLS